MCQNLRGPAGWGVGRHQGTKEGRKMSKFSRNPSSQDSDREPESASGISRRGLLDGTAKIAGMAGLAGAMGGER